MSTSRNPERAEFVIDDEIAALIPSLASEELALLERSLLAEGCREPLIVWDGGRRKILVDGHNRCRICRRHGVPYKIKLIKLPDRDAAIRWVAEHQLGRRNLTPEAYAYLRGKLYNGMKRQGSRSDLTSGQSAQKSTTAQQLAAQHKVDEKTIRREGRFAEQLDALAEVAGADIKNEVITRGARISRADIPRLLQLDAPLRRRVIAEVKQGARASALLREARDGTGDVGRDEADRASSGNMNDALEQLSLAEGALCTATVGGVSAEMIARIEERLRALGAALEPHRRAVARAPIDVAAALQVVADLGTDPVLRDASYIFDNVSTARARQGAAHREKLVVAERRLKQLLSTNPSRRHRTSRRRGGGGAAVRPRPSARCRAAADAWLAFDAAQRYLNQILPRLELAFNTHGECAHTNPTSARIRETVFRFIDAGGVTIADGLYAVADYLGDHGVDAAVRREALPLVYRDTMAECNAIIRGAGAALERMRAPATLPRAPMLAAATQHEPHLQPLELAKQKDAPGVSALVASMPSSISSEKSLAECKEFCDWYLKSRVSPEGALVEIEKKNWPEHLKEHARKRITEDGSMRWHRQPPPRAGG